MALKNRKKLITTTKVEQSPAGPLHALRAEGTVADIYIYIYIYIYINININIEIHHTLHPGP